MSKVRYECRAVPEIGEKIFGGGYDVIDDVIMMLYAKNGPFSATFRPPRAREKLLQSKYRLGHTVAKSGQLFEAPNRRSKGRKWAPKGAKVQNFAPKI